MIVVTIVLAIAGLLVGGGGTYAYTKRNEGKAAEDAKKNCKKPKRKPPKRFVKPKKTRPDA